MYISASQYREIDSQARQMRAEAMRDLFVAFIGLFRAAPALPRGKTA